MVGIPMGTKGAPLLADLFLHSYKNEFLDKLIKDGKKKLARKFNLSHRILMTLSLSIIKDSRSSFLIFIPKNLQFLKPFYLNLLFIRDKSNNIMTKLHDKLDAFGFHIVNFSFMSNNIPSAPAYGVYASQLIRYAHCCSKYNDFL